MADVVLVPGLWLQGSTWDAVVPHLERAGHRPRPLTLPGTAPDADRAGVGTTALVAAVVAAIDETPDGVPVVVVGHSMGCAVVHGAVDARPERVARAVHVGGFPSSSGRPPAAGFGTDGDDLPFPGWDAMDDADVRDLDEATRARVQATMVPSPAGLTTDPLVLGDERRFAVPVTMVCPEFTSDQVRAWVADGDLPELAAVRDVEYVDLDSGHWPQVTRPAELAAAIASAAARADAT